MNNSLRRRVAAVATAATVGGLLLPFLAAGTASALAPGIGVPTAITVDSTPVYTRTTVAATFTGTLVVDANANANPVGRVYATAVSGPDLNGNLAVPCSAVYGGSFAAPTYTCSFTTSAAAGIDSMRLFYDPASAAGTYVAATYPVVTSASLSVAGPVSKVAIAPTAAAGAQGNFTQFTATATDAINLPVPGALLNLTATENLATSGTSALLPGNIGLIGDTRPGPQSPTTALPQPSGTGTAFPATATTTDGTNAAGTVNAKFYVASQVAGTVNFTVQSDTVKGLTASGALTVDGGTPEAVTAVTVTPAPQRAFISDIAQAVVNVRNLQGDNVAGINPVVTVTGGTNQGALVTYVGGVTATDFNGNVSVTYPTNGTAGSDTLTAFVNQKSGSTSGLDPGEPNGFTTVNTSAFDLTVAGITTTASLNAPVSNKPVTAVYTVVNTGTTSLAGYNVRFAVGAGTLNIAKYTLSSSTGVTDASGKVSVTLTNANARGGDVPTVVATVGGSGANVRSVSATVNYLASAVSNNSIKINPFANTTTVKGTTSLSATVNDQFGNPVTGASYAWTVAGRNVGQGVTSSNSTLSYTDTGSATQQGTDTVNLQVSTTANNVTTVSNTSAMQAWVTTAGTATQANIDVTLAGNYTQSTSTGPVIPSGFVTSKTGVAVTADPTSTTTTNPLTQKVIVKLTDANNNRLWGKSVSFSSSGVGGFTDVTGKPIGSSTTAVVADANAVTKDINPLTLAGNGILVADSAAVFVRSTQGGTQTITATVDGLSSTATISYTGQFVGIAPIRVVDTRSGQGAISAGSNGAAPGPIAPNTFYNFNYSSAGMPTGGFGAYVFNVTAINPSGVGNLRLAPGVGAAGTVTVPTTSVINYQPGQTVANQVIIPNPAAGAGQDTLTLYSDTASANVAIDLVGYYPTAAGITNLTPSRIADTRNGAGPVAAGGTSSFQVSGTGTVGLITGIPTSGAKAVALNVTVVNPSNLGNLRIFADGAAVPTTSNINYIPGQDKSAFVIVNLPANGKIDVYSDGVAVNVAIDAYAWYATSTNIVTQTPVRILDSRTNSSTLAAGGSLDVQVGGAGGVPANAQSVLVSVTSIHTNGSTGSGFLRAFPSGGTVPNYSTLNYVSPTADVANFAMVKLGTNGAITLNTQGSPTDVAVDVLGYVPAGQ